jgi:hypothetical protein
VKFTDDTVSPRKSGLLWICLLLLPVLLTCSCTPVFKENRISQCSSFDIKFSNETRENRLFFRDLKNSLENKLDLVVNKNIRGTGPCVCELVLDVGGTNFPSILGDDGGVKGENRVVNVGYRIKILGEQTSNRLSLFYSTTSSVFRYSDRTKRKRDDSNMVETLAEDIFLGLVRHLS